MAVEAGRDLQKVPRRTSRTRFLTVDAPHDVRLVLLLVNLSPVPYVFAEAETNTPSHPRL
jgi:hypothetical protein